MQPEYVPILKARKGEFEGVTNLAKRNGITPVFEIPPFPSDLNMSLDGYVEGSALRFGRVGIRWRMSGSMRANSTTVKFFRMAPALSHDCSADCGIHTSPQSQY